MNNALTYFGPEDLTPGAALRKPPTQIAGVQGIAPKPIELTPARQPIDWMRLSGLPPFQMYLRETRRASLSEIARIADAANRDRQIEALMAVIDRLGPQLYDEYAEWHREKGCWPHETPMGEARSG